jgi:hypothetical protein
MSKLLLHDIRVGVAKTILHSRLFARKFAYPGREVRAGSRRKTLESDETWKQYSSERIRFRLEPGKTGSRIRSPDSWVEFLVSSCGFPPKIHGILRQESSTWVCTRVFQALAFDWKEKIKFSLSDLKTATINGVPYFHRIIPIS